MHHPVRLRFTATVETPIALPSSAGSALRGAFGHALRALACTTRAPSCEACPLAGNCPFPAVFAPRFLPQLAQETRQQAHRDDSPPFVIEPFTVFDRSPNNYASNEAAADPRTETETAHSPDHAIPTQRLPRDYAAGDTLVFHQVVWGAAREHLPFVLMAWQRALARGVGLRLTAPFAQQDPADNDNDNDNNVDNNSYEHAAPARLAIGTATLTALHAITHDGQALPAWDTQSGSLNPAALSAAQYCPPAPLACPSWLEQGCMLRLHSPLRLQQQGHVLAAQALSAQAVLAAMLRRCHNAGLPASVPSIKYTAPTLGFSKHLRWRDAGRYSSTQQQATPLGGLVGNLVFTGDMRAFWPILHAAQWLHVGKETVFGLGGCTVLPVYAAHMLKKLRG